MNLINKLFLQKAGALCTVLALTGCGGGNDVFNNDSTRNALSATDELQNIADNASAKPLSVATPRGLLSNYSPAAAALTADAVIYSGTLDLPYYFDPSASTKSLYRYSCVCWRAC